jgi:hypothetical protein
MLHLCVIDFEFLGCFVKRKGKYKFSNCFCEKNYDNSNSKDYSESCIGISVLAFFHCIWLVFLQCTLHVIVGVKELFSETQGATSGTAFRDTGAE